jgi:hypothetical protein
MIRMIGISGFEILEVSIGQHKEHLLAIGAIVLTVSGSSRVIEYRSVASPPIPKELTAEWK